MLKMFLHLDMHCSCYVLPHCHLLEDLSSQSLTTAYAMYLNPHSTSEGCHVLVIRYSLYTELYIQFIIYRLPMVVLILILMEYGIKRHHEIAKVDCK
jgi:hypothetical protein